MNQSISILIPTYARTRVLVSALHSALTQNYPGAVEVLVLNDCPWQHLEADLRIPTAAKLRIVNEHRQYATLGDKRNAMVRLASHEWVTFVDDDDELLPEHCQRILGVEGRFDVVDCTRSWYAHGINAYRRVESGPHPIDLAVRRRWAEGKFPSIDVGEDQAFRGAVLDTPGRRTVDVPTYVYRWGNGVCHLSGIGDRVLAASVFRRGADERRASGFEPEGIVTIEITPPTGAPA